MQNCSRLLWSMVLLLFLMPCRAEVSPRDRNEAFQWFDQLQLIDLRGKPAVNVATASWTRIGNAAPVIHYKIGFLLEEKGDSFTVFFTDLSTGTFQATAPGVAEHERVGYEKVNLEEVAEAKIKAVNAPFDEDARLWQGFDKQASLSTELFVIARACALQGLDRQAAELCDLAEASGEGTSLQSTLATDIGHTQMWRAVLAFGDPSISREELLLRFQQLVRQFPSSEHHDRAQATAELLAKMVEEDREHAGNARPLDQLQGKELIAELIFQLRDQNGHQWSQPGSCDIFSDPRGKMSPATQLVNIGFDAVPQLIEVIDDRRFTRSVGYHRDFYFSHHVLSVGEVAQEVLEHITGRNFYLRTDTNTEAANDDGSSATRKAAKAWWAEVEAKGEKYVLTEAVAGGGRHVIRQAARLVEKYPDDALSAIEKGLAVDNDDYSRSLLLTVAGDLKGDEVTKLLLRELSEGGSATRLAAAMALHQRGRKKEAVDAMIVQWQNTHRGSYITFLAECGDARAVQALAAELDQRAVGIRGEVVRSFVHRGTVSGSELDAPTSGDSPEADMAVETAVEDLLAAALDDTERCTGTSLSWDDVSFTNPRVCDLAAFALSRRFPDRYRYDHTASPGQRDVNRLKMLNVWREAHGKEPLPLPESVKVEPVSANVIDPLIEAWLAASKDPDARRRAADAIEAAGLGTLPAVWKAAHSDTADVESRQGLTMLAQRVASIVREVIVSDGSVKPDESLQEQLEALKGKPLTASAFVRIMLQTTNHLPRGATGIQLAAHRDRDGSGITLTINLTRTGALQATEQKGWSTDFSAEVAGQSLRNSSGMSSLEHAQTPEAYEVESRFIEKALGADPYANVEIHIGAVLGK